MPRENPYFDPTYANAGVALAEALFGNQEKAGEVEYKRANTRLAQEKAARQADENAAMAALVGTLSGSAGGPEQYQANQAQMFADLIRAGAAAQVPGIQGAWLSGQGMGRAPAETDAMARAALVGRGSQPALDFAMSPGEADRIRAQKEALKPAKTGKSAKTYAPKSLSAKDMEVFSAALDAELGRLYPGMGSKDVPAQVKRVGTQEFSRQRDPIAGVAALIDTLQAGVPPGVEYRGAQGRWNPFVENTPAGFYEGDKPFDIVQALSGGVPSAAVPPGLMAPSPDVPPSLPPVFSGLPVDTPTAGEGKIVVNPKTGERLIQRGGQWQPLN